MKLDQNKIKEILLKENYIKKGDAEKADEFAKTGEGGFLDYFMRKGLLTADFLGQALAEYFEVSYFDLNTNMPDKALVLKIPEQMAKNFRAVLAKETEKDQKWSRGRLRFAILIERVRGKDGPGDRRLRHYGYPFG